MATNKSLPSIRDLVNEPVCIVQGEISVNFERVRLTVDVYSQNNQPNWWHHVYGARFGKSECSAFFSASENGQVVLGKESFELGNSQLVKELVNNYLPSESKDKLLRISSAEVHNREPFQGTFSYGNSPQHKETFSGKGKLSIDYLIERDSTS